VARQGPCSPSHHFGRSQYSPFDRSLFNHATIGGIISLPTWHGGAGLCTAAPGMATLGEARGSGGLLAAAPVSR
jgi:hypothetical protein